MAKKKLPKPLPAGYDHWFDAKRTSKRNWTVTPRIDSPIGAPIGRLNNLQCANAAEIANALARAEVGDTSILDGQADEYTRVLRQEDAVIICGLPNNGRGVALFQLGSARLS
jgi:hypothetical protein